MSSPQPNKLLAFFGATGGCVGHALALSLNAGYTCTALARTPSKLTASLKAKGVGAETLSQHLIIIPGDGRDSAAVRQTLQPQKGGQIVDVIISGVGGVPRLQWSIWKPVVLNDATICQDVGGVILAAARAITAPDQASKPLFINISTTGIPSPGSPWDVPFWLTWFYTWVLQDPHADKEELEKTLRREADAAATGGGDASGIAGFVNVKPSLLMDGEGRGIEAIRWGTDSSPAIGYTIQRGDVGRFIFERMVREDGVQEEGWRNKSVSITY